jgi:hypothetical protein
MRFIRIRLMKPMRRTGLVLVIVVATGMVLVVVDSTVVVVPEAWTTPLSAFSVLVTLDGIGVGDGVGAMGVVVVGVTMVGMVVAVIGVTVRPRRRLNSPRRAIGVLLVVVVITTGVPLCVVTGVSSAALAVEKVPATRAVANRNAFMMFSS